MAQLASFSTETGRAIRRAAVPDHTYALPRQSFASCSTDSIGETASRCRRAGVDQLSV